MSKCLSIVDQRVSRYRSDAGFLLWSHPSIHGSYDQNILRLHLSIQKSCGSDLSYTHIQSYSAQTHMNLFQAAGRDSRCGDNVQSNIVVSICLELQFWILSGPHIKTLNQPMASVWGGATWIIWNLFQNIILHDVFKTFKRKKYIFCDMKICNNYYNYTERVVNGTYLFLANILFNNDPSVKWASSWLY